MSIDVDYVIEVKVGDLHFFQFLMYLFVHAGIRINISTFSEGEYDCGKTDSITIQQAFYFSQVNSWKKVFFRLPYGGAYMDNEDMAKCICNFLPNYFEFEKKLHGKVKYLIAVESMDFGYYKITLSDNEIIELEESLLYQPKFEEKIGKLIKS